MVYYTPMDRDYGNLNNDIYISDVGTSANPTIHQTQALKAKIFEGASTIEIGSFMGTGKGNKQAFTPETFGKTERQDMRDLAEYNEVETTTHAAPGAGPLSGFNPQQNTFSDEQREATLKEIKKAIDFAADASTGGAVVFHTGEWHRPITEFYGKEGFKGYPEEEKRAVLMLADEDTGEVQAIKKDMKFYIPKEPIEHITDEKGNEIPIYDRDEDGLIKVREITFKELVDEERKLHPEETEGKRDEEVALKAYFSRQLEQAKGSALYYGRDVTEFKDQLKKIRKTKKFYGDLKKNVPKEDWWKYKESIPFRHFVPPDVTDPVEYLENAEHEIRDRITYMQELNMANAKEVKQIQKKIERLKPIEDVGIKKTADSVARAAVFAMEKNKQHPELKNPLFVAPESYDANMYGSHPDEMRKIILESRKKMVDELSGPRYKYDEKKAEEIANKTIKATFDIGHVNVWRQHFERRQGESLEHLDKRFNNWLVDESKKLAKEGILGHIHLSDNFGFDDEHVTPGEGNAPIKEFVEEMKKAGLKKFIVEPGSFNPTTALPDTWSMLGSPVYSIARPGIPNTWTEIHRSYFGRTARPFYVIGEFGKTISEDYIGAPFYTGLPLE